MSRTACPVLVPVLVFGLLSVGVLCVGGCGSGGEQITDPRAWQERGDVAYKSGAEMTADFVGRAGAYTDAAVCYRNAFRLQDPTPARADARALLAFRIGRSLSLAARADPESPWSERRGQDALFWFDQTSAIKPAMRQVWFERGLMRESLTPGVRDLTRARDAYERYLAALEAVPQVPASEVARSKRARERLEALAGQLAGQLSSD